MSLCSRLKKIVRYRGDFNVKFEETYLPLDPVHFNLLFWLYINIALWLAMRLYTIAVQKIYLDM